VPSIISGLVPSILLYVYIFIFKKIKNLHIIYFIIILRI
jgi:hypothetical protein